MAHVSATLLMAFVQLISLSISFLLPNLTGTYDVGTVALELINPTTSPPRDLMLSFFYPSSSCSSYPLGPDFPPLTAEFLNEDLGVPDGVTQSIITQSHALAPLLSTNFPILLFSPGLGVPRLLYTVTAEDVASLGYIVVTIDHPNDSSFIEYPDGRVAIFPGVNFTVYDEYIPLVDNRVSDLRYVLDSFSNDSFISQIPGWKTTSKGKKEGSCFKTDRVGVLGHSLGGATAASTMLADKRFVAGVNLDGAVIGNVTTLGLSEPFMMMSSAVHNRTNDPTWATFWPNLRGFRRELAVAGTLHSSFGDYAPLAADAVTLGLLPQNVTELLVGTINGLRMPQIESAYVGAFFNKFLKGKRENLLDGPSKLFPEVSFDD